MKILLCHNYYQHRAGEEQVFQDESRLLEAHGHEVLRFTMDNRSIRDASRWKVAGQALWNPSAYREIRGLIRRTRPALLHCTNYFPLISPSLYYAAGAEGVPVVQSLHNFRLLCPHGPFFHRDRICEKCLGKAIPWPALQTACYRQSRSATAVVAAMVTAHRVLRTWRRKIDRYIALSEFARQKYLEGGFAADRIDVKPNFVHPDPGAGEGRGG